MSSEDLPNILAVDDDFAVRMAMDFMFKKWPEYNLILAEDAKDALAKLEERDYMMMFSDINMPEISGLELLDVQKNQRKKLIPVRYRTVLKTPSPQKTIKKLLKNNIRAIVPIEDWELLDDGLQCPNALKLTKNTVSIPCFPSLTNNDFLALVIAVS